MTNLQILDIQNNSSFTISGIPESNKLKIINTNNSNFTMLNTVRNIFCIIN